MNVVIDVNVAVKWYVPEDFSDDAMFLLELFKNKQINVYAPVTMKAEFANAIRKYVIRKIISREIAEEILSEIKTIPINYCNITWKIIIDAFEYAFKKSITVYDAIYVILAKNLSAKFITADKRLYSAISKEPEVLFIADVKTKIM